jgi:hypothetical protein
MMAASLGLNIQIHNSASLMKFILALREHLAAGKGKDLLINSLQRKTAN